VASKLKEQLLQRKKELQEQLKPLKKLEQELEEVETLLSMYDRPKRGGWETPGHENGCRCHECDPSR
jgi:hypothetical protein